MGGSSFTELPDSPERAGFAAGRHSHRRDPDIFNDHQGEKTKRKAGFSNILSEVGEKTSPSFWICHKTCLTLQVAPLRQPLTNGAQAGSQGNARV
jgi:hypothetical protein